MGCAAPPSPPAPAEAELAAAPAGDHEAAPTPDATPPMLRGTPLTIEEMLGSLRLSPDGGLGTVPVF
jgi:hypothetical protein